VRLVQPAGWPRPKGYAHATCALGATVFVSGQIGWDEGGRFVAPDIAGQTHQALSNVVAVLAAAGARPEHVARMTWYVVDKREYLDAQGAIGDAYREVMGRHFPAMSVVEVRALVEDAARVEIEATAVIPDTEASARRASGNAQAMNDRSNQRTETDERVAENQAGVSIAPVTRDDDPTVDPQTGMPRGMHDNDQSPLDRGPGEAQQQAFGNSQEHSAPADRP